MDRMPDLVIGLPRANLEPKHSCRGYRHWSEKNVLLKGVTKGRLTGCLHLYKKGDIPRISLTPPSSCHVGSQKKPKVGRRRSSGGAYCWLQDFSSLSPETPRNQNWYGRMIGTLRQDGLSTSQSFESERVIVVPTFAIGPKRNRKTKTQNIEVESATTISRHR